MARDCRKKTEYLQNNQTSGWSGTDDKGKGKPGTGGIITTSRKGRKDVTKWRGTTTRKTHIRSMDWIDPDWWSSDWSTALWTDPAWEQAAGDERQQSEQYAGDKNWYDNDDGWSQKLEHNFARQLGV